MQPSRGMRLRWIAGLSLTVLGVCHAEPGSFPAPPRDYVADGRLPAQVLLERVDALKSRHRWEAETVYTYPESEEAPIRAWRTSHRGPALWIIAGIHGEEPAGPNSIAASILPLAKLAADEVPIVVLPLCNPRAYRQNWRYPNTPERDWRKGPGYSVGDAEWLLPDFKNERQPRAAAAPGPETAALTSYALQLAQTYPPLLVLDLHEDELSTAGGYVYTQGRLAPGGDYDSAKGQGASTGSSKERRDLVVAREIARLLQGAGMQLRMSGRTRFDEPIVDGLVSSDDAGRPLLDGSIDELLSAPRVLRDGKLANGPGAPTSIVVETPAFAGADLEQRVAAHAAVLAQIETLWRLNQKSLE